MKAKGIILGDLVLVLTPPCPLSLALKQIICAHGNKSSSIKKIPVKNYNLFFSCLVSFNSLYRGKLVLPGVRSLNLYFHYILSVSLGLPTLRVLSHFSRVQLSATLWTVACQAPLSLGFAKSEYWSGLPYPSSGDLPNPGIESTSPVYPILAGGFFTSEPMGKATNFSQYQSISQYGNQRVSHTTLLFTMFNSDSVLYPLLKLNVYIFKQRLKFLFVIMYLWISSVPITSWQIDGETMETVTDFIFSGSKIIADCDCSHEIKRCLLLGRKARTNLDSILKSRTITLLTKFLMVEAIAFPVVMCRCENWTIRKPESQRTDAFKLWCDS